MAMDEAAYEPPPEAVALVMATALLAAGRPSVPRSTIRAMLPKGQSVPYPTDPEKTRNTISTALYRSIRRFEKAGWIIRDGADLCILDAEAIEKWLSGNSPEEK